VRGGGCVTHSGVRMALSAARFDAENKVLSFEEPERTCALARRSNRKEA